MSSTEFISPWDLPTLTPEPEPEIQEPLSTEQELELWTQRAHDLWNSAILAGDVRSAAQAVNIALRNLKNRIEKEKACAEKLFDPAKENLSEAQKELFRAYLDGIVTEYQEKKTR